MKKKKTSVIRRIALITSAIAVAGIAVIFALKGGDIENVIRQPQPQQEAETAAEPRQTSEPLDTLFFASDYQSESGWDAPSVTLTGILQAVKRDGKNPTNVVFCGDYTNVPGKSDYELSPDSPIQEIKSIIASECKDISEKDLIFEQGNHDQLTSAITPTGLYEYENYYVYVLNTQYEFPWKQGKNTAYKDRVVNASKDLKKSLEALIERGETRPVFIAGHVPLHFTAKTSSRFTSGENMYSSYIFDAVNSCAESLDIVYLFGHDHTKGWDCYLGGSSVFRIPGDILLIPDDEGHSRDTDTYVERTLNFTYMNAGYVGFYINCSPKSYRSGQGYKYRAADETLTGTVCEILPTEMIIYRYSTNGLHDLCGTGEGNPYRNNIDDGLIDPKYFSNRRKSPVHVERKALISKLQIF